MPDEEEIKTRICTVNEGDVGPECVMCGRPSGVEHNKVFTRSNKEVIEVPTINNWRT